MLEVDTYFDGHSQKLQLYVTIFVRDFAIDSGTTCGRPRTVSLVTEMLVMFIEGSLGKSAETQVVEPRSLESKREPFQ